METITIRGKKFNLEKRVDGVQGKSNTVVYLTRPRGKVAHIAAEYVRQDGTKFYSAITPLTSFRIK